MGTPVVNLVKLYFSSACIFRALFLCAIHCQDGFKEIDLKHSSSNEFNQEIYSYTHFIPAVTHFTLTDPNPKTSCCQEEKEICKTLRSRPHQILSKGVVMIVVMVVNPIWSRLFLPFKGPGGGL